MADYQIVTDATADLSPELLEATRAAVISMNLDIDGAPYVYGPEGGTISPAQFYAALREGKTATTSQINPTDYEAYFERFLSRGVDVLYIAFSSGLSGSYQGSLIAAESLKEKYPDRKVLCVDSLCASVGEGFLVYAAALRQQAGDDIDTLYNWLNDNLLKVAHWFTVDDLGHLRRGGRISSTTAVLGSMLQIKPVLHVDNEGHLVNVSKARGRKRSLEALADKLDETWVPEMGSYVMIGHGDSQADADFLASLIKQRHATAQLSVMPIGPIIGAHSGPGTIALFFWGTVR